MTDAIAKNNSTIEDFYTSSTTKIIDNSNYIYHESDLINMEIYNCNHSHIYYLIPEFYRLNVKMFDESRSDYWDFDTYKYIPKMVSSANSTIDIIRSTISYGTCTICATVTSKSITIGVTFSKISRRNYELTCGASVIAI